MMNNDDSMSDDVFEESDAERKSVMKQQHRNGATNGKALAVAAASRDAMRTTDEHAPSPTGYPGYKPPAEALRMYAYENDGEYFHPSPVKLDKRKTAAATVTSAGGEQPNKEAGDGADDSDTGDGWKSYTIEDDSGFDENVIHKV